MSTFNERVALLFAKTGVFFANCDGVYDKREKDFINEFVSSLKGISIISDEIAHIILNTDSNEITFESITEDTTRVLSECDKDTNETLLAALENFIDKVIKADGIIHPNEKKYFNEWKKNF
jgi:hypothetical protein